MKGSFFMSMRGRRRAADGAKDESGELEHGDEDDEEAVEADVRRGNCARPSLVSAPGRPGASGLK
jgi:hypothetical protein